ncbi:MAG: hypothetical protein QGG09_21770 [Pirellulaceae bacterium]|nr:hypothetical protein [Pirellulaceae bacterium]
MTKYATDDGSHERRVTGKKKVLSEQPDAGTKPSQAAQHGSKDDPLDCIEHGYPNFTYIRQFVYLLSIQTAFRTNNQFTN